MHDHRHARPLFAVGQLSETYVGFPRGGSWLAKSHDDLAIPSLLCRVKRRCAVGSTLLGATLGIGVVDCDPCRWSCDRSAMAAKAWAKTGRAQEIVGIFVRGARRVTLYIHTWRSSYRKVMSIMNISAGFLCEIAVLSVVVAGCSSGPAANNDVVEPLIGRDYAFTALDVPTERRFKLILEAKSRRQICTGNSRWPTTAGYMEGASNRTFVIVGDRRYAYKDVDMDVCPSRVCGNPMDKGMRLESSLFYKDFSLPEALYGLPKSLSYSPRPFWCDTAHWIDGPRKR